MINANQLYDFLTNNPNTLIKIFYANVSNKFYGLNSQLSFAGQINYYLNRNFI